MLRRLPVLLLLACDDPAPSQPSAPSPVAAPPAEAGEPADAAGDGDAEPGGEAGGGEPGSPAEAKQDVQDAAFFVVRDRGVVVLTKAGFAKLPGTENTYLSEFVFGADGVLYGRTSSAVVRVRTDGLPLVAELDYDEVGSVSRFDVGKSGAIWTIGSNGVSEYREGKWRTQSKSEVGLTDEYAVGIALDTSDEPWAATAAAIVRRKDGNWEPASLPKGPTKYLSAMGRGPDGEIYISTFSKLFRLTGTPGAVKVKTERYGSPGEFAFAQETYGVAKSGIKSASIFLPADKAARYGDQDLQIGAVGSVAADTQGRVWAAGDGGVAIMGPGDAKVTWRSGSVEEVAGQVMKIVVRGAGPPLPEAGEVQRGGLKGQIIKDGKGVAGVKIEMCESPSLVFSRSPCHGAPTHLKGTTDADGSFTFEDVPLGAYGIAVKAGKGPGWKITLGAALGAQMTAGATYDIGSVELK